MTEIKTTTAWGPKVKRSGLVSVTPMRARPKGTLVPGIRGEMYPCKPDIFDKTYELVTERGEVEG